MQIWSMVKPVMVEFAGECCQYSFSILVLSIGGGGLVRERPNLAHLTIKSG